MSDHKQAQYAGEILKATGAYFAKESNKTSLITFTRTTISGDLKHMTIFFSVMPEDKEESVQHFLNRHRSDLRHFIKKKIRARVIPFILFKPDIQEKNRQRMDEVFRSLKEDEDK